MKRTLIVMVLVTVITVLIIIAVGLKIKLSSVENTLAVERESIELLRRMVDSCQAARHKVPVNWDLPELSLPALAAPPESLKKEYRLSRDYLSDNIPTWTQALAEFKGKPNLRYLEVGVFEGRSAVWMFENILTDPTSKMTAIDLFPENLKEQFLANVEIAGASDRVTTLVGYSQEVLRDLSLHSFDIMYIDGSHHGPDVLEDAVLSWRLLKSGGVVIFDDYLWHDSDIFIPKERRPKLAVDTFYKFFGDRFDLVHNGYQVILKKK